MVDNRQESVIGIDLGGTNCRVGMVTRTGEVLFSRHFPVGDRRSESAVLDFLTEAIQACRAADATFTMSGVGIGVPALVDYQAQIAKAAPHFPKWKNFPLSRDLAGRIGQPVIIDNDAHMIAIGEGWCGAGRDVPNFIQLTLGTGIGGALMQSGNVWHGDRGFAGEVGHMVIDVNGPACPCGGRGCLERYASASGFVNLLNKLGLDPAVTPLQAFAMAERGDPNGSRIWQEFGSYLACGVSSLVNVTGMETVIIGGGLAKAWPYFYPALRQELANRLYDETRRRVSVRPTELGETAGVIGAARVIFRQNPPGEVP